VYGRKPEIGEINAMSNPVNLEEVWKDLYSLIESLPEEDRNRYQRAFSVFAHDIRSAIGIIYSAESLLRRKADSATGDIELLDLIRESSKRAMRLITEFALPTSHEETRPIQSPSARPKTE